MLRNQTKSYNKGNFNKHKIVVLRIIGKIASHWINICLIGRLRWWNLNGLRYFDKPWNVYQFLPLNKTNLANE